MSKSKMSYITKDGCGMEIEIEPTDKESPKYKAIAKIIEPDKLNMYNNDPETTVIMAAAMRQVMDMYDWEDMFEVKTVNFTLAGMGDQDPNLDSMMLGGPIGEA